jgi:transcriptional regulator with XRE-family HTH domain
MSGEQDELTDWLPSDVSVQEALKVLQDPGNLDFYRFAARLLENTSSLDEITEYVDPELLVKEFPKVKNHMKHGELDGSHRKFWEKHVQQLSREPGPESNESGTVSGRKRSEEPDQSSEAPEAPDPKTTVDPESVSVEESPPSAAETGKPEQTTTARHKKKEDPEMMEGVQADIGFNEQVSEAARSVSKELRELRQKRGMTRNELAENSDLSLPLISEIERGRKELTYELIERYASGLDMSLELDFRKQGDESTNVLQQVKQHIDDTINELDVNQELAEHTRMVLYQIAEDGLYQHRFPTLRDALNYLEEAVRKFSIRDDAPDPGIFSNGALFRFLKSQVEQMQYSDLAYDENIKIVGQKVLERFHE